MKQVETRYVVIRKSDKSLWQGGNTNFFSSNIATAKLYTTRKMAEKQIWNAWWREPKDKDLLTVEQVTITYEI